MSSERAPRVSSKQETEAMMRNCIRKYKKQMKTLEYARLRSLVPSVALQPRVSKIQVIEEAIKYIAQLQETLAARFDTATPETTPAATQAHNSERRPKLVREKKRRLASYMIKTQRHTLASRRKVGGRNIKGHKQSR